MILGAVAISLHGPDLGRPFGIHEINAANYFGVFARNFHQLGFGALRGAPVGPMLLPAIDHPAVVPYLSHPPGLFWLYALAGPSEGALRGVSAVGHTAGAWLLTVLLRGPLGPIRALAAGLLTLLVPVLAFYTQVSYETAVLPAGLLLLLAWQRGWRRVLATTALFGPWLDWQFGFFLAALVVLALRQSFGQAVRTLVLPAGCALLSLAGIFGWRWYAQQLWTRPAGADSSVVRLIEQTIGTRPPLAEFALQLSDRLLESYTLPVLMLAAVGLPFLVRRAPSLTLALLFAGSLNLLVFPAHSMGHTLYTAYLAPLLAAAIAAAGCGIARIAAVLPLAAVLVAGASAAHETHDLRQRTATPFFRDLGRALSAAADGQHPVCFNLPYCYGFYVDSADVLMQLQPLVDRHTLEAHRSSATLPAAIRYLWVKAEDDAGRVSPLVPQPAALEQYLAGWPRQRLPQLEQTLTIPPRGDVVRIVEAWLVTLTQ